MHKDLLKSQLCQIGSICFNINSGKVYEVKGYIVFIWKHAVNKVITSQAENSSAQTSAYIQGHIQCNLLME